MIKAEIIKQKVEEYMPTFEAIRKDLETEIEPKTESEIEPEQETTIEQQTTSNGVIPSLIPDWIKNIALWYGQGNVTEEEFINAIKYLLNQGIIEV